MRRWTSSISCAGFALPRRPRPSRSSGAAGGTTRCRRGPAGPAGEHLRVALDRRDLAGLVPAARVAARGELARGAPARRPGSAARSRCRARSRTGPRLVGMTGGFRFAGSSGNAGPSEAARSEQCSDAERARRVEQAGERRAGCRRTSATASPSESSSSDSRRLLGADRRRAAAAVDEDEPGEAARRRACR